MVKEGRQIDVSPIGANLEGRLCALQATRPLCGWRVVLIMGALTFFARPTSACTCFAAPACAYVNRSSVIFVGRVTFSNDDGSGSFVQATLIRFEVEEAFKGLAPDTRAVWLDPGSFTSCYANYEVGQRYLVFASGKRDFAHMVATTFVDGPAMRKPSPPGFDSKHPPTVYLSTLCSGTLKVDAVPNEVVQNDLDYLRSWREGRSTTRIFGRVLDHHRPDWPLRDVPVLQGVMVSLTGAAQKLTAVTQSDGAYSFDGIPPGNYSLSATLEGYRAYPDSVNFDLAPGTCGYREINMITDGLLEGTVKNYLGEPAKGVEVLVRRRLPGGELGFLERGLTDENGSFKFSELPAGDLYLGVNLGRRPSVRQPYLPIFFPGTSQPSAIHLSRGEQRKDLTLKLPPPLKTRTVDVTVTWADGTPVPRAGVWALDLDGSLAESARTDRSGHASLVCLDDTPYQIYAKKWLAGASFANPIAAQSEHHTLPMNHTKGALKLVLNKASRDH